MIFFSFVEGGVCNRYRLLFFKLLNIFRFGIEQTSSNFLICPSEVVIVFCIKEFLKSLISTELLAQNHASVWYINCRRAAKPLISWVGLAD